VVSEIQKLHSLGHSIVQICKLLEIKEDTLKKAIRAGRVLLSSNNEHGANTAQNKSERSLTDDHPGMGKACVNMLKRILSTKTGTPCPINFSPQVDLNHAGVLLSLPALVANGLLKYQEDFYPDTGYYSIASIFLSLAFLSLLRIKTLSESSRLPPGELGRAIGLDRIPEVKTLRERIALFCEKADIDSWSLKLSKDWMEEYPELSAVLYIDGHVKIYFGSTTKMPKRFVSRLRLCMSGSTDYWVNDMTGQPFFVINKVVNSSMIEVIKNDIIPRVGTDVPNQPTEEELDGNPFLHRFMIVFDRECYSPDFFYDLWQDRIAICTYNKNVKDIWPDEEFSKQKGQLPFGAEQEMEIAERGVLLQNKGSKKKVWAREIRRKTETGHQISIITTNFMLETIMVGLYMFARWTQENFFKYVMQNFGIDTLVSFCKEKVSDTIVLVNPEYRDLEGQQKRLTSKLNHRKSKYATMELAELPTEEQKMKSYIQKKSELVDQITALEKEIELVKTSKKEVPRKIKYSELPEEQKFDNVINERKRFLDIIKMIAYRAETAMSNMIKPLMSHPNESRILLQKIYQTDANIYPDYGKNVLTIEIHNLAYWKDDKILQKLCEQLNKSETKFPGTELTICYKMVSSKNP
jgi:hypothetical protein